MADVSLIAVNYRSGGRLVDCVASVLERRGDLDVEVVVVDNGSDDGSLDGLPSVAADAIVIVTGRNVGFGAGVNRGLAAATAPYVLVVNPDARLTKGDLGSFVGALAGQPRAAVGGPRIESPDGALSFTQVRFPSLWREIVEALRLQKLPGLRNAGRTVADQSRYERDGRPDWLAGAVLLFRREALAAVGGFDEGYFLYWEEIDWCFRARQAGWEVAYLHAVTFVHEGGGVRRRPELFATFVASNLRFYERHHRPVRARAHRAVLALNLGLRLAGARLGAVRGGRRREDIAVFSAGLRELRHGGVALQPPSQVAA